MASLSVRNLTLRRLANTRSVSSSSIRCASSLLSKNEFSLLRASSKAPLENQRRHKTSYGLEGTPLSERDQKYFEKGWMDERGLTLFKTLHENQVRACDIFAQNPLYGTYSQEQDDFVYKTYAEFGEQVNRARDVLKHLGRFRPKGKYYPLCLVS